MGDPKQWLNVHQRVVHPDAPRGDGGPGHFGSTTPLGSGGSLVNSIPDPYSLAGLNAVFDNRQKEQILVAADADAGATGAPGPTIAVNNGWANPSGAQDRTTVGIGELCSFVVVDAVGGRWKSADGTGTNPNSVTLVWTAGAAGTNKITYTAADGRISTVTMTIVAPDSLSGTKVGDITTFAKGVQGAGMNLTITVNPTTVSFQAIEIMEETCAASAISGYFSTHTPPSHDAAAGAGTWSTVGTKNDVSDTADTSGWPKPWSQGSYTWAIPARWRKVGDTTTGTAFRATSDQVITIAGVDGTTTVTKLGATSAARKP
jgi:hypothetical protein